MESTLHALGGLLLRAIPTFVLVLLIHFYLKKMFFKPLEHVRQQRYEATEGARLRAQQSMERAEAKAAEYGAALRAAQANVYQAQEQLHRQLQDRQSAELQEARQKADALVQQARADLAREVEAQKDALERESDSLAERIADSILRRSAA